MRQIKAGTTNVSVVIRIIDATDGTPETGVVWNTAGIDLEYRREGAVSVDIVEVTLAALTTAHADGGFLHIGNGYYRLDLPDAACAASATGVLIHGTVTGMVVLGEYIELVTYDPQDAVRLGLTALPDAAADDAGGLPISDVGGLDLDTILGRITANVALASIATETRLARLDATVSSRSSHDAAAVKTAIEAGASHLALIKAVTDLLPDAGALTTIGTDTARLTAVRAAVLTDWINAGRLDAILDAIKAVTDKFDAARPEPSQGQPPKEPTFWEFMAWLWMGFRNQETETPSEKALYNDAGAKLAKAALSDDATTFTKAKFLTGA